MKGSEQLIQSSACLLRSAGCQRQTSACCGAGEAAARWANERPSPKPRGCRWP